MARHKHRQKEEGVAWRQAIGLARGLVLMAFHCVRLVHEGVVGQVGGGVCLTLDEVLAQWQTNSGCGGR
jgi:hypothetical protein